MTLSIGKRRGLAQCATQRGTFAILALDHRGNLRQALNPADPKSVPFESMVEFKRQVVSALGPHSSAVLLDPEIGSAPVVAGDDLPGRSGLIVAVEETGYTGNPTGRVSRVQPGWSVGKIRRMGASAVKLLVYYHPQSPQAAQQEDLVRQVAADCSKYDLPLFLEPLSYSLDPNQKKLNSADRRNVVIETARRLTELGIDILKAEFPLDIREEPDETVWAEACSELTQASITPWTLLSAGVDFETFLRQVTVACEAGAGGVLAGRAIWKEAAETSGAARLDFLRTTAAERMDRVGALCDALARPWKENFQSKPVSQDWYTQYPDL
jgi:tagatose 1,6-diphosphate aldolase